MNGFRVDGKDLSEALALLLTVAEPKGTIPVLAFTLLEFSENKLRLSATDIGRSIITEVNGTGDAIFSLCVRIKQFHDLVKLLEGEIVVSEKENSLQVSAGTSCHLLPVMEASKFPLIQEAKDNQGQIEGATLASMLSAVSFCVGRNPNLERWCQTFLIEAQNESLSITACNGPQLANAQIPFSGSLIAVVPYDGIKPLTEMASRVDSLTLALNERFLTARSGSTSLSLQLSTDKWPDWRMLVKPSYVHSAEFEVRQLGLALRRSILSCEPELPVKGVKFELSKTAAVLTASGRGQGEGSETVEIKCLSLNGDAVASRLAGDLLLDALRTLKTGTALWEFGDDAIPRFTLKEQGAFSFQYLQNPLSF
jgi:DNA polymerase III sliding clamp (beta) subunit (PCNA family)